MGYLSENSSWEEKVKQIEPHERVKGGPDGPPNVQARHLANRTRFLKDSLKKTDDKVKLIEGKVGDSRISDCLKKAQNLADLSDKAKARINLGVASAGHRHDGVYASADHDHDGIYSPVGHSHSPSDIDAAPAFHLHDERYLKKTDYSSASVVAKVKAADGAGSGIDADTVDGKHAAAFAPAVHNHTAASIGAAPSGYGIGESVTKKIVDLNSARLGGLFYWTTGAVNAPGSAGSLFVLPRLNGYLDQIAIVYEGGSTFKRYFNGKSWTKWVKSWDSENDGSGSGLDADTLDGKQAKAFAPTVHSHGEYELKGNKNKAGGYAGLDSSGKIIKTLFPSGIGGIKSSGKGYIAFQNGLKIQWGEEAPLSNPIISKLYKILYPISFSSYIMFFCVRNMKVYHKAELSGFSVCYSPGEGDIYNYVQPWAWMVIGF